MRKHLNHRSELEIKVFSGENIPVALALIQHLNLTEDTTAAVTWSFFNHLETK